MGGLILLLMVVGVVVLTVFLDSTVRVGVESIGPSITGTKVTLEKVDLSLLSGEGQLEKLVIGNPPGFHTDHAFYFGTVQVKADFQSMWSDTIHIREILIDSPDISYESTTSGSNFDVIHENIGAFGRSDNPPGNGSGGGEPGEQKKSPQKPSNQQKIEIDQFILKNGRVRVSTTLLKDQMITVRLPMVQIKDIGKQSGGITLQEMASLIYSETQNAIEQEISKSGIPVGKDLKKLDKILNKATEFLEGFQGLFGK